MPDVGENWQLLNVNCPPIALFWLKLIPAVEAKEVSPAIKQSLNVASIAAVALVPIFKVFPKKVRLLKISVAIVVIEIPPPLFLHDTKLFIVHVILEDIPVMLLNVIPFRAFEWAIFELELFEPNVVFSVCDGASENALLAPDTEFPVRTVFAKRAIVNAVVLVLYITVLFVIVQGCVVTFNPAFLPKTQFEITPFNEA